MNLYGQSEKRREIMNIKPPGPEAFAEMTKDNLLQFANDSYANNVYQNDLIDKLKEAIAQVSYCHNNNTGNEPSLSCFNRALDEALALTSK
tara:strand:- start:3114 stop:3386 length:273 start_codon:yes stop_codon:yes gene_type:complete